MDPSGNIFSEISRTNVNTPSGGNPSGSSNPFKNIIDNTKKEICKLLNGNEECKPKPESGGGSSTFNEDKAREKVENEERILKELIPKLMLKQGIKTYKKVQVKAKDELYNLAHSLERATVYIITTTGECLEAGAEVILEHPKETAFVVIVGVTAYFFPPAIAAL